MAEVSSRHLSFLETGRARPSREMVLHLAEHLDVPLRERNAMLLAAGFAPTYPTKPLDDASMRPVTSALDAVLAAHQPYPAVIVDRHWNLVSANPVAFLLTSEVDHQELLDPPVNVIRLSFHPGGLAPHILNFPEYAAHLVARLRRQVDHTADPVLTALLEEACEHTGTNAAEADHGPDEVVLPMRLRLGSDELTLFSTIAVFGAPREVTLDELAIEAFYPADDATAAILQRRDATG